MTNKLFYSNGIILLLVLVLISNTLHGQKRIDGNGTIVQDTRMLKMFSKLKVELNGEIIVHPGTQPKVMIETDENIVKKVQTIVSKNELLITKREWIEPTEKFKIHVYTPMLTKIVSDSWVKISMMDVSQERLQVNIENGQLTASGRVDELELISEKGTFDLENLTVGSADIELSSSASVIICCVEELSKDLNENAILKIINNLEASQKEDSPKTALKYIDFEIVNNSWTRNHFVVRGPKGHRFSYGFPMNPGFSKAERWPIGTKVYKSSRIGIETLLIEIKAENENKKISLFQE